MVSKSTLSCIINPLISITVNYVHHVKFCIFMIQKYLIIYKYIISFLLYVLFVWENQRCIFVHANSAAAVSIESIFATKCTICILCTSDVQRSREQNIIDFNKCCSCETTLQIKLIFLPLLAILQGYRGGD